MDNNAILVAGKFSRHFLGRIALCQTVLVKLGYAAEVADVLKRDGGKGRGNGGRGR